MKVERTERELRPMLVRCLDRTVFEIDRTTLEPKTSGYYDAWAYSDPRPDVDYMEHSDWCNARRT